MGPTHDSRRPRHSAELLLLQRPFHCPPVAEDSHRLEEGRDATACGGIFVNGKRRDQSSGRPLRRRAVGRAVQSFSESQRVLQEVFKWEAPGSETEFFQSVLSESLGCSRSYIAVSLNRLEFHRRRQLPYTSPDCWVVNNLIMGKMRPKKADPRDSPQLRMFHTLYDRRGGRDDDDDWSSAFNEKRLRQIIRTPRKYYTPPIIGLEHNEDWTAIEVLEVFRTAIVTTREYVWQFSSVANRLRELKWRLRILAALPAGVYGDKDAHVKERKAVLKALLHTTELANANLPILRKALSREKASDSADSLLAVWGGDVPPDLQNKSETHLFAKYIESKAKEESHQQAFQAADATIDLLEKIVCLLEDEVHTFVANAEKLGRAAASSQATTIAEVLPAAVRGALLSNYGDSGCLLESHIAFLGNDLETASGVNQSECCSGYPDKPNSYRCWSVWTSEDMGKSGDAFLARYSPLLSECPQLTAAMLEDLASRNLGSANQALLLVSKMWHHAHFFSHRMQTHMRINRLCVAKLQLRLNDLANKTFEQYPSLRQQIIRDVQQRSRRLKYTHKICRLLQLLAAILAESSYGKSACILNQLLDEIASDESVPSISPESDWKADAERVLHDQLSVDPTAIFAAVDKCFSEMAALLSQSIEAFLQRAEQTNQPPAKLDNLWKVAALSYAIIEWEPPRGRQDAKTVGGFVISFLDKLQESQPFWLRDISCTPYKVDREVPLTEIRAESDPVVKIIHHAQLTPRIESTPRECMEKPDTHAHVGEDTACLWEDTGLSGVPLIEFLTVIEEGVRKGSKQYKVRELRGKPKKRWRRTFKRIFRRGCQCGVRHV